MKGPREPNWAAMPRVELLSRLPSDAPASVLREVSLLRREVLQAWCLLWYRSQHPGRGCLYISDRALAGELGCVERTARRRLKALADRGLVERLRGRRKGGRSGNGSIRFLVVAGSPAARAPLFRWAGRGGRSFEWRRDELVAERDEAAHTAGPSSVSARPSEPKCPPETPEVSARGGQSVRPTSVVENLKALRGPHAVEAEGASSSAPRGLSFSKLDTWPASGSRRLRELKHRLGSTWVRPRERRERLERFLAAMPSRALEGLLDALGEAARSEPLSLLELWARRPRALERICSDPRAFVASPAGDAAADELGLRRLAKIEGEIGVSVRSDALREDLAGLLTGRSTEWRTAFAGSLQRRRARELARGERGDPWALVAHVLGNPEQRAELERNPCALARWESPEAEAESEERQRRQAGWRPPPLNALAHLVAPMLEGVASTPSEAQLVARRDAALDDLLREELRRRSA